MITSSFSHFAFLKIDFCAFGDLTLSPSLPLLGVALARREGIITYFFTLSIKRKSTKKKKDIQGGTGGKSPTFFKKY